MRSSISASEALRLLLEKAESVRALDVRSEGEFSQAAVPGFLNLPILSDSERHEVGICYKQRGQEEAILLGQKLTEPHRAARLDGWARALAGTEFPLVTCFRGGLRSRIACEWLASEGVHALRVEGGYKALRAKLLRAVEGLPEMLVLSGPTGSGKTELLRELGVPVLDLELLARHKGSAFGGSLLSRQPAQATFENSLGLHLLKAPPLLVEDESAMIGHVCVPNSVRRRIAEGRVVRIRMSAEERAARIYREYVADPVGEGIALDRLFLHYEKALHNIERRLGGSATQEILKLLKRAFSSGDPQANEAQHREWILALLIAYYDRAYEYSFQKVPRETAFEGDWESCKLWIQKKFA